MLKGTSLRSFLSKQYLMMHSNIVKNFIMNISIILLLYNMSIFLYFLSEIQVQLAQILEQI